MQQLIVTIIYLQNKACATASPHQWVPAAPTTWRPEWRYSPERNWRATPRSRSPGCRASWAARRPSSTVGLPTSYSTSHSNMPQIRDYISGVKWFRPP